MARAERRTFATIATYRPGMLRHAALASSLLLAACAAPATRPSVQAVSPPPVPIEAPRPVSAAPIRAAEAPSEALFPPLPPVDDGADIPERRMDAATAPAEVLARIRAGDGSSVAVARPGVGSRCRIQFVTGAATGVRANPLDCLDSAFASVRGFRIDGRDVIVTDGDGRDVARLAVGGGFFAWTPSDLMPRLAPAR